MSTQKSGEKERLLEKAAFEAGEAIQSGEHTLENLENIVRWKSKRVAHYLIGNSTEKSIARWPLPHAPKAQRMLQ